jgi:2-polyprenyl-3-methyl-5-hydroxy-6-metoxy-1,4-benzoquinol methylase
MHTPKPSLSPSKCFCVACQNPAFYFGSRGNYDYFRCGSCATLQLHPLPAVEFLEAAYAKSYAQAGHYADTPEESDRANAPFYEATLAVLRQRGVADKPILDVGCGWGGLGRLLQKENRAGYVGVDASAEAAEFCRASGLNVLQGGLELFRDDVERFAAIACLSVFEHLADHRGFLDDARRLLAPGGQLLILSPTAGFAGMMARLYQLATLSKRLPELHQTFCPPWHVALFSLPGVRTLLGKHGFNPPDIYPSPSGNAQGMLAIIKSISTRVGAAGFRIFGESWPVIPAHIVVACKPGANRSNSL